ncbi:MAG: endo-1,4-beta-xylanase [Elusimicrobia bacterium]|nr:endo-1,4-beta-xylanase [Elusimicrobiota bacterium]
MLFTLFFAGLHCAAYASAPAGPSLLPSSATRIERVIVRAEHAHVWDVQRSVLINEAVSAGDRLVARFSMRSADPRGRPARLEMVFEGRAPRYEKAVARHYAAGPRWRTFQVAFRALRDYAPGEAGLKLRFGFGPQELETAELSLVNAGPGRVEDIPSTPLDYQGRKFDAPWRREALRRIGRLRTAELQVRAVDSRGRPIPAAKIRVRMLRSAFHFGAVVRDGLLLKRRAPYRRILEDSFNSAVIENSLKWPFWNGKRRERALEELRWLNERGLRVRGHCLVWPGWSHLPAELAALDNARLAEAVISHVTEEVSTLKGLVAEWDVVNEPIDNRDLFERLGADADAAWFSAARAADPGARLAVNDFGQLGDGGGHLAHKRAFEAYVDRLLRLRAPLDRIGLQAHFDERLPAPERLLADLDRLSRWGMPLEITELEISIADERLQSDYLRDVLLAAYSHPAVSGVTLWALWDGGGDRSSALYRRDWTPKPSARAWNDLVRKAWRTDSVVEADAHGQARVQGHLGLYEISEEGGAALRMELPVSGAVVTLKRRR